jgi:hypothetical protein
MWITRSKIPPDRLEDVKTVVSTGKFAQDPTFKYRIEGLKLIMESGDRTTAFHRGGWFLHKVDSRMTYEVTEVADAAC